MTKVALVAHWDWVLYNFRLPLALRLRERGLDIALICPRGEYVGRLQDAGLRWLDWRVERHGMNPLRDAVSLLRLAALYRRERFHAVQHFTIKPALYGSLAARLARVPTVINTFTGLGFLFSGDPTAARLRPLVRALLRWLLRLPSVHTVFQNEGDRGYFVESGLAPAAKTTLIAGSGVDTDRFAPGRATAIGHDIIVLTAARLLWDKGIGEFIDVAQALRARGVRARFWIAGQPDPTSPSAVPAETLRAWRRAGPVEFLGYRKDMPLLLREASIAVLATSYQEGLPLFLLEAAATGLPLVATDIDGCRLAVRPGVNGLLVPVKDAAALADAIAHLVADPALRARMGRASRALAVEEFAEARVLDAYEALYRHLGALT